MSCFLPTHLSEDHQRRHVDADRPVYASGVICPVDDFGIPALEGCQFTEH